MGAGSYSAGSGYAAFDQVGATATAQPVTLSTKYDPRARTIPIEASGTPEAAHWVDQTMVLRLTNAKGDIPAAPELGVDRDRLRVADETNYVSVVTSVVTDAIADLIALGAVLVERIEASFALGRIGYRVVYRNLFAPGSPSQTIET